MSTPNNTGPIEPLHVEPGPLDVLQESASRYRALVDHAPYCIHELDAGGRFLSMNSAGLRMMQMKDPSGILGLLYLDAVATADRPRISKLLELAQAGQMSSFKFTAVNGRSFSSNFVPLAGGTIMGITLDSTDRKRADEALRESEERFQSFMNQSPVVAWVKDEQFKMCYANSAFEKLFDRPAEQIHGRTDYELYSKESADETRANNVQVLESGQSLDTIEHVSGADGRMRRWLVQKFPLYRTGQPTWVGGTAVDVTARVEFEEAVRESESRRQRYAQALASLWQAKLFRPGHRQAALQEITRTAARTLQIQRVSVWLYNEDRSKIQCHCLYDAKTDDYSAGVELAAGAFPAYFAALEENRSMAADDAHTDPRTREFSASYLTPLGIASMLDVQIRLDEGVQGVLRHEHVGKVPCHWTTDSKSFAAAMADLVALTYQTDRRFQSETALQQSLHHRQLIFDAALDAIIVMDQEGMIASWNPRAEATFGWSGAEVIGRSLADTIIPAHLRSAHQGGCNTIWPREKDRS
ncbi:MAG: PAS domain S-box protein [Gemmataceae bacterium]|nr:PAS domain S-box protein [Gemmataceae bacterium]